MNLQAKALACLEMAEELHRRDRPHRESFEAYGRLYQAATERWSQKAVLSKFEELVSRGYLDCGVSARTGWLTQKGRDTLQRNSTGAST